jgi:hypothetical protein
MKPGNEARVFIQTVQGDLAKNREALISHLSDYRPLLHSKIRILFDARFITAYQSPFTEAQNGGDDKTA